MEMSCILPNRHVSLGAVLGSKEAASKEAAMIHPDDVNGARDWELYGPRNADIPRLVYALAESGMRLDAIEALIEALLREKLRELEASQPI